jgi:hypothetical protein
MTDILWYLIFIAIGLALDWAMSERLKTALEYFLKKTPIVRYREVLFPRILLTLISVLIIAHATAQPVTKNALFFIGFALFLMSLLYGLNQSFAARFKP